MSFRQAEITIGFDMIEALDAAPAIAPARSNTLQAVPLIRRLLQGVNGGQANKGYFRKETIGSGATITRDLNGTLTDRDGNTIDLDLLDFLIVVNFNTNGSVSVGPLGAANAVAGLATPATGGAICYPARSSADPGVVLWSIPAGLAITAGSADEIQLINNDGANDADIYWGFVGRDTP